MTADRFEELALSLPEATVSEQSDRPDYRVREKIFASLFPRDNWAVIKMTRELQAELVQHQPELFRPCNGAWGRNGATIVFFQDAEEGTVLRALMSAWRKNAPPSVRQREGQPEL